MDFELLRPEHYGKLNPFFAGQKYPLSAYSLASLIAWSQCIFDTLFAVDSDAVLFAERRMDDPQRKHLLLPVGPGELKPPAWLRERALATGYRQYHHVPQSYLERFGAVEIQKYFTISELLEDEDYVYGAAALAELQGRDYSKKRNLIRQFERAFEAPGRVEVRLIAPENAGECLGCLEGWREERLGEDWTAVLECERRAITKCLENFSGLQLQGVMVCVDNKVRGFGIGSRLKEDTWTLHFEKATDQIKGLYQFLDRECAKRLFHGVEFLNKESDMGDAGLAQAKQSYRPAFRVKSYQLALR